MFWKFWFLRMALGTLFIKVVK